MPLEKPAFVAFPVLSDLSVRLNVLRRVSVLRLYEKKKWLLVVLELSLVSSGWADIIIEG